MCILHIRQKFNHEPKLTAAIKFLFEIMARTHTIERFPPKIFVWIIICFLKFHQIICRKTEVYWKAKALSQRFDLFFYLLYRKMLLFIYQILI